MTPAPAPRWWSRAWFVWIALFLVIELTGVALTPDAVGTLSVHVWGEWFPEPWARGVLLLFWLVVGVHFANRGRRWYADGRAVAITGALAGLVALWHAWRERRQVVGLSGLTDKIVRALALRWLRGKVNDKEGALGKALKLLDGWKLMIGVVLLFAVAVYDQMQNGHAGDLLGAVLTILGWMPAADWLTQIKEAAPAGVILVGFLARLVKAWRQARAGATATELLTTEGYVKQSIAEKGTAQTLSDAGVARAARLAPTAAAR